MFSDARNAPAGNGPMYIMAARTVSGRNPVPALNRSILKRDLGANGRRQLARTMRKLIVIGTAVRDHADKSLPVLLSFRRKLLL